MVSEIEIPFRLQVVLKAYGAELVCKSDSALMKFVGFFMRAAFMTNLWTTVRLPFWKGPVIYYPEGGEPRLEAAWIIEHELHHVRQFAPWYGPLWVGLLYFLLPLPIGFSGRWFIERYAYLGDIKAGRRTPKSAVAALSRYYVYPWPKKWMRAWFDDRLDF